MNEFKVGLLAIATIVAVVIMSLKVTSNQSGFGQYVTYRTIVKDASGIFPKTPIKVAGINAGRISSIELQGNTALITFEILKQIQVTKNSKLRIKSVGFLGDKYIEIFVGDSSEMLRKFDFIDSEEAAGLENLIKDTSEVLADVKLIVRSLKDSIAPEGEVSPVKKILNDVQELVANAKDVTATLKRVANNNEEKLNNIFDNFEAFSSDLAYQSDRNNSDSVVSDVKVVLANTKKLTGDLEAIVADLRRGKGTLGKILVEDEIADQVKDTLSSVQKIVGKADAIRTELSIFSGVNSVSGGDTEAALRIYPSPERFYHLGIATSEIGPDYEKTTVTTTNGVTTTENKKENEKNTLRFNAQIGRRVHDLDFRGGLIESTGGLGVDYRLQPISTKFILDAFDYKKGKGANIRFAAETQLWNVFYGRVSANDSFRSTRSGTVAAGLRFNDEDLKGLIGFFW
ncbi:MAG: MlaD family protein [Bacteriovorax sp.]|jgi:phospholipid/cholesterol/gamma-HCH transport system substrate-binding protein